MYVVKWRKRLRAYVQVKLFAPHNNWVYIFYCYVRPILKLSQPYLDKAVGGGFDATALRITGAGRVTKHSLHRYKQQVPGC